MSTNKVSVEVNHSVEMFEKYKNLLVELTRKNIKLKYRNSWLGIFWSFLQPLLNMIVLSVVFAGIFGRNSKYITCYPVYLFSGRLMFDFFSTSTKQAMSSFRRNALIIKKVYVPKYMYPLSSIFSSFVTFAISLICYICVWIFFKVTGISGGAGLQVSWQVVLSFIPMFLVLVFSTGVGLILSILCVYFRDIEYIWDVAMRLLFYMVPLIYPIEKITTPWMVKVIESNPLYSMIEMFRQCVLYGRLMDTHMVIHAAIFAVVTLIVGVLIFNWKSDDLVFHL